MTRDQTARLLRFVELIEEADALLDHDFWISLPKHTRERFEDIPGFDSVDRTFVQRMREMIAREQEEV